MKISFLRESSPEETRVSLTPLIAKKYLSLGIDVTAETGIGGTLFQDSEYSSIGVHITSDKNALFHGDLLFSIRSLSSEALQVIGTQEHKPLLISYLDPFNSMDSLERIQKSGASAISLEMIPRTTRAQKMDVLSSQASLAGYAAVIIAAEKSKKSFPMMMTPAGTLQPVQVFIIGAGVAGLQAIATAKRLGAKVEAFDTRPVVEEQVQSLGAKFVKADLGETGQTEGGYAKELTPEQLQKQQEAMAKACARANVVITTAQLFGRKAPRILPKSTLSQMQPGSIAIDLAVETGGNIEGSEIDKENLVEGVRVIGIGNLPGRVSADASQMLSSNLYHITSEFYDKEQQQFQLDLEDDILSGCVVIHQGKLIHPMVLEHYAKTSSTAQ